MLRMMLAEIAQVSNGTLTHAQESVEVNGVSTDTRTLKPGNLFIALQGERFDGHDHIDAAFAAGAAACLASRAGRENTTGATVRVQDTLSALQQIAHAWRLKHTLPVIAITGSNGKSTVKEMIASILNAHCDDVPNAVLATRGNLNNHIGVPLMLCELNLLHRYAVLEAGMSHFGEISLLSRLIAPQTALINNAGPAHLEGVGSLAGVARAKAEIFDGLNTTGVSVLNADDAFIEYWAQLLIGRPVVRFGRGATCDVRGEWTDAREFAPLAVYGGEIPIQVRFPLAGDHNRMNALAAAAVALSVGVPMAAISKGLSRCKQLSGRQTLRQGRNGATLIDDTYNANLASITAGMNTLSLREGKRIVVLGQIAEQGEHSEAMHRAVGQAFRAAKLDKLYATGLPMKFAVEEAGARGQWFASKGELIAAVEEELAPNVSILIKGARSAAMEDVMSALLDSPTTMETH